MGYFETLVEQHTAAFAEWGARAVFVQDYKWMVTEHVASLRAMTTGQPHEDCILLELSPCSWAELTADALPGHRLSGVLADADFDAEPVPCPRDRFRDESELGYELALEIRRHHRASPRAAIESWLSEYEGVLLKAVLEKRALSLRQDVLDYARAIRDPAVGFPPWTRVEVLENIACFARAVADRHCDGPRAVASLVEGWVTMIREVPMKEVEKILALERMQ